MNEKVKEALRKVERKGVLGEIAEIEINAEDDEVYNACLEIRNQLVPDSYNEGDLLRWDFLQAKDESLRKEDGNSEGQKSINGSVTKNKN